MTRPAPSILLKKFHNDMGKTTEIVYAANYYVLLYKGQPVNMRLKSDDFKVPAYGRTGFANKAHAIRLAESLNEMFKTDDFTIGVPTAYEIVK